MNPEIYVVFPVDALEKKPYSEVLMKEKWPRTYGYLTLFRAAFKNRQSKAAKMLAERTAFYVMLGYGPYTVSNFKVVWKRMSDDVFASVVSHYKTPYGYKTLIPLGTTSFFSPASEDEAHYLCALINSMPVREHIKSYSSAGRGFGAPSVMEHVGIVKFDETNEVHKKLSELSKSLHKLKAEGQTAQIEALERQVDEAAAELFTIS